MRFGFEVWLIFIIAEGSVSLATTDLALARQNDVCQALSKKLPSET